MGAKEDIIVCLSLSSKPLAVHEPPVSLCSDTAISARLREMARDGYVIGVKRPGKAYKQWSLAFRLELI